MGFINYHGDKQDNYDTIIELADEAKRIQAEKNRKKTQADFFGVQRLANLDTRDILVQLVLYFKRIRNQHNEIISRSRCNDFDDSQTFTDLWLFSMSSLLNQSALSLEKRIKVTDQLISKAFQLNSSTDASEHYAFIKKAPLYRKYLTDAFDGETGNLYYWHWLSGLDHQQGIIRLYDDYLTTYRMLAFYLNQVFPEQGIGIKSLENWIDKECGYKRSLFGIKCYIDPAERLNNPLYGKDGDRIIDHETPETGNELISAYMRYRRVIVGGSMNLDDNLLIGALYKNYNSGKIASEKVPSILPEKCRYMLKNGKIPAITDEDSASLFGNDELLHYLENAVRLIPLDDKGSRFQNLHGKVYITDRQIVFKSVSSICRINSENLERIVLYDSDPDILEIAGRDESMILCTANTEETYRFLKLINVGPHHDQNRLKNLETMSTNDFRQDSLESYIFTLDELADADLPEDMKTSLTAVSEAIKALVNALEQYPSEASQSYKFKEYYIPEIVNLTNSYIEYNKAGVSENVIKPVYTKVMNALADVEAAAKQRINEIYQVATMGTKAKADALQRVLGQDGYRQ